MAYSPVPTTNEDTASANADAGIILFATRKATPANTSGTDGDYETLQVSAGRLWTNSMITDSNAAAILSAAHALNSTGAGVLAAQMVGEFDDTSPTAITENQFGNLRMSANRNLYGTLRDAAGNERGANVNASNQLSVSVDALVALPTGTNSVGKISDITASVVPGTAATNLGKAEDAAHTTGDTGVMLLAVRESTVTDLSAGNTNGDYEPLQVDGNGALWVSQATLLAGEDLTNNVLKVEQRFSFANMTSATTTTIKSGAGFLHALTINTPVASATITIYDNTAGSGTLIGKITLGGTLANDVYGDFLYDVSFATGLTIVTSGATDLTISFR